MRFINAKRENESQMIPKEITRFYNKYKQKLYNISYRILWDEMEAEDVVQETIIKYLKANNHITNDIQREAWLMKSCVRLSIDVLRKRMSMKQLYDNYQKELEDNAAFAIDEEEYDDNIWNELIATDKKSNLITLIRNELSTMPDGYRSILSMVLFEGLDYGEIAEYLGIAESSVRSQYMRGKKRLADKLKKVISI